MALPAPQRVRLTLIVAALVAASGGGAGATPPGENGRIAFTRYSDAERSDGAIFTIGADGRRERRVTSPSGGTIDQHPDWSRDGSRIVFERCTRTGCRVATVAAGGGAVRVLTRACRVQFEPSCAAYGGPAYSPDGSLIAATRTWGATKTPLGVPCDTCGFDPRAEHSEIVLVGTRGRLIRRVIQVGGWSAQLLRPQFSPDGRRLVFERHNSWLVEPKGGVALFVIGVDGRGLRRLTPWRIGAGDGPDWAPAGSSVVFRAPRFAFAGSNLHTIGANGRGLRQLTRFPPRVEVLSSSFSPDGHVIVFARTGRAGLPDLFTIRADGSNMRPLTRTAAWDSAPDWGPR